MYRYLIDFVVLSVKYILRKIYKLDLFKIFFKIIVEVIFI